MLNFLKCKKIAWVVSTFMLKLLKCMKYNFQEFNMRQKYLSLFSAICYCLDADMLSERLASVQEGIKEQAIVLPYSY